LISTRRKQDKKSRKPGNQIIRKAGKEEMGLGKEAGSQEFFSNTFLISYFPDSKFFLASCLTFS
jgi:hypothetical protein